MLFFLLFITNTFQVYLAFSQAQKSTREIVYVENSDENTPFFRRDQDLFTLFIKGIKEGRLKAFDIQYKEKLKKEELTLIEFNERLILEKREIIAWQEKKVYSKWSDPIIYEGKYYKSISRDNMGFQPDSHPKKWKVLVEDELFPMLLPTDMNLLGLDVWKSSKSKREDKIISVNYIHFYFPAHMSAQGSDQYLFSVAWEDAVEFLRSYKNIAYHRNTMENWFSGNVITLYKKYFLDYYLTPFIRNFLENDVKLTNQQNTEFDTTKYLDNNKQFQLYNGKIYVEHKKTNDSFQIENIYLEIPSSTYLERNQLRYQTNKEQLQLFKKNVQKASVLQIGDALSAGVLRLANSKDYPTQKLNSYGKAQEKISYGKASKFKPTSLFTFTKYEINLKDSTNKKQLQKLPTLLTELAKIEKIKPYIMSKDQSRKYLDNNSLLEKISLAQSGVLFNEEDTYLPSEIVEKNGILYEVKGNEEVLGKEAELKALPPMYIPIEELYEIEITYKEVFDIQGENKKIIPFNLSLISPSDAPHNITGISKVLFTADWTDVKNAINKDAFGKDIIDTIENFYLNASLVYTDHIFVD